MVVDTDKADAHRNPLASYKFLLQCGIQVQLSDLVMQARLYDGPLTVHPLIASMCAPTPPPFPGQVKLPPMRHAQDLTYTERIAREMAERQDPRA